MMIMTTAIWSSMNLKRKAKQTETQAWGLLIHLHCLIMSHFRVVYTKLSPLLKISGKEKDFGES